MDEGMKKDHLVLFPFMAIGHTIPLIHMAAALSARNVRVSIVTTPANAPTFRRSLPLELHPDVNLLILPFPSFPPIPAGCESTDQLPSFNLFPVFVSATNLFRQPFKHLLHQLMRSDSPPSCLVSDFFLGWTFNICQELGLPRVVFHGMSTFSMSISKALWNNIPADSNGGAFHVPGAPSTFLIQREDIPDTILTSTDPLNPATQFLTPIADLDISSWGVLVNSFSDLDGDQFVRLFESFYTEAKARAWLVGPLSLLSETLLNESRTSMAPCWDDEEGCMEWLNSGSRSPRSVVYVSFGTQADVSSEQLDEVAYGLEECGYEYLWVVRSNRWTPPTDAVGTKGKIVRWAPQGLVLKHEVIGGFVSHCGWNSVLDGVSAGVPFLAWPMVAEQRLNAKHVVNDLGVGLRIETGADGALIRRESVRDGIGELMEGEMGRKARQRIEELRKKAKLAVADGGSSRSTLQEFIEALRARPQVLQRDADGEIKEGEMVRVEEELQFDFSAFRIA